MTKERYNKGDAYEDDVFRILTEKKLLPENCKRGGASNKCDVQFIHNGKTFQVEVKNVWSTDFGQKRLSWSKEKDWHWIKKDSITDFYDKLGVIKFLKARNIIPIRYTKDKSLITQTDKRKDQNNFEGKMDVPLEALLKYYENKDCFYIQIGGSGFYHLRKDAANLGTQPLDCKLWMRFRAKAHTTDPAHNYSFFAVLKLVSRPLKSKFSLDNTAGQIFPLITP